MSLGARETLEYVRRKRFDLYPLYEDCPGPLSLYSCAKRLRWDGGVLGELDTNRVEAVLRGVRYVPWREMMGRHMASSTVGVPHVQGAKLACLVAERIMRAKDEGDHRAINDLSFGVVKRVFEDLCRFYGLPTGETEAMFDDNATMVLYQFLGLLGLSADDHLLTFMILEG